jgi:predicted nucleic acid-binding protein
MLFVLWDASALVKRYVPETGSDVVSELFANVPSIQMVTTFAGYAEVHAALVRKRNRGAFSAMAFQAAVSALQSEVIYDPEFGVLDVESSAILAGIALVEKHNLNSSDAGILATFFRYAQLEATAGNHCLLVAADVRLVRAAVAEGIPSIDPEALSTVDVGPLLASL